MNFLSLLEKKNDKLYLDVNILNGFSINEFEYFTDDIFETILSDIKFKNKLFDVYIGDKFIKDFTFAEFYLQCIFWKANIVFKIPITEIDFRIVPNMVSDDIHNVIEDLLKHFKVHFNKNKIDLENLSDIASWIIEKIMKFSNIFSWISPDSISIYDIIQFAKRNSTFRKLINTRIDENMNIKDVEHLLDKYGAELVQVIKEDKKNCLYQYVATGTVNKAQLRQMFVVVGYRMDIDKVILPYPIKGNFLNGLQDVVEQYAEAVTARNALIDKEKYVSDSGYEARKIDLNNFDTDIDHSVEDCGTKHYLTVKVDSEYELDMLDNKYQILDDGSLYAIDSKRDLHLIGKEIKIRSHIFCALPKNVCRTCYGANSDIMKGTRIGGFPSLKVQNKISNKTISSKHYLETNAASITSKALLRFFEIESETCYLKTDLDYSRIKLVVDKLYFENLMEQIRSSDSDDEFDMIALEGAYIVESTFDKTTNDYVDTIYSLDDLQNMSLYLTSEIFEEKACIKTNPSSEVVEILLGKLDVDVPILEISIISEGITFYLNKFVRTIDSKEINNYSHPNELMKEIIFILKEIKLSSKIQHLETLIYNLIKDGEDLSRRPDFKKKNVNIAFLPVKNAIMYKDPYTSLSFERYQNQLKYVSFFKRKGTGAFDTFFRTKPIYKL